MNPYMLLMFAGTFLTAISQVLLKQSANRTYRHPVFEYLNWRVILSYGIFFGVLLLNTYAYTQVDMKYGAVIDTCSYLFVMILSWLLLKERFSRGQLIGNLIILTGIFIYTLPL
ncbi:MAG TPA: DMT family transporter [Candidatus Blautia gallistercoris]|uniref:DMT family transporter n=1 Tax=Candidatus Blautia gallistercoris TaxID=2838490 RepID=A0A9D1WJP5_9FIRM|nr:DMT family transporter [Candidatus Blautia gallistercoris]